MNYELEQDWTILPGDKTLKRAFAHQAKRTGNNSALSYQFDQINNAINLCKQHRTGLDIGANYGLMSYHMSSRFDNVHAYEIEPNVYECLKINLKKFNLHNVKPHPYGIGDKEDSVALSYNKKQSTFSTHVTPGSSGDCAVKQLDMLGLTDVDFIKIDAEGFEPLIIQGGMELIKKYTPVILYECKGHESRFGFDRNNVLNQLAQLGYAEIADAGGKNKIIGIK